MTGMPGPAGPETGAGTIHARGRRDQQRFAPAGCRGDLASTRGHWRAARQALRAGAGRVAEQAFGGKDAHEAAEACAKARPLVS